MNAQHPLAAREQVPFHELRDFEFIMSSEDSHRQIMTLKFQKQGFTPKVRHHVAMMYNVLELVERNLGIALIPSTMNTEKFSGIKMIDVTPAFPCSFSMAIRKGDETDAVRVFVDSYTKSIAKKQLTQAK